MVVEPAWVFVSAELPFIAFPVLFRTREKAYLN